MHFNLTSSIYLFILVACCYIALTIQEEEIFELNLTDEFDDVNTENNHQMSNVNKLEAEQTTSNSATPKKYINSPTWEQLSPLQQAQFEGTGAKIYKYHVKEEATSFSFIHYSPADFNAKIQPVRNKKTFYYDNTDTYLYEALTHYSIKDKRVLIIGSTTPLYEVIALEYGAKEVIVLEYNKRTFEYDDYKNKLKYVTMPEFKKMINNNDDDYQFDACISISSVEHDGLGRYGDDLNPWADIYHMKEMLKWIKVDGIVFFAVPVGEDAIIFNLHRVYGYNRLPLLKQCWSEIATVGFSNIDPLLNLETSKEHNKVYGYHQPVFILQRMKDELLPPFCREILHK